MWDGRWWQYVGLPRATAQDQRRAAILENDLISDTDTQIFRREIEQSDKFKQKIWMPMKRYNWFETVRYNRPIKKSDLEIDNCVG
jgi:hypothetical protein